MCFITSTIVCKNSDDFRRVLAFVKPDESDTDCKTMEEYEQLKEFVNSLSGTEQCAWITRHCYRLGLDFWTNTDKLELAWQEYAHDNWPDKIIELVVGQFPDIDFYVSSCLSENVDPHPQITYGLSEQGKIKWLELSDDVNDMLYFGVDVDPYKEPTTENWEELRRCRKARVQEMIDLGVHISPDTWPPTKEQYDEETNLIIEKIRGEQSSTDNEEVIDNPDLPF